MLIGSGKLLIKQQPMAGVTAWERSAPSDVEYRAAVPRAWCSGRREVVMRYNTKDEIEATGEWLMRINEAETPEELLYVPSELSKMGVAPIDVVDRLDYLREQKKAISVPAIGVAPVVAHEEPEDEQEPEEDETAEDEEPMALDPADVSEEPPIPYAEYGAWEWVDMIEKLIEESLPALFELEADLPEFNKLALELRPKQPRARGKRARSGSSSSPVQRAKELVSISAGATQ